MTVFLADAVCEPGAVVVKGCNTSVAVFAVFGSDGLGDLADETFIV